MFRRLIFHESPIIFHTSSKKHVFSSTFELQGKFWFFLVNRTALTRIVNDKKAPTLPYTTLAPIFSYLTWLRYFLFSEPQLVVRIFKLHIVCMRENCTFSCYDSRALRYRFGEPVGRSVPEDSAFSFFQNRFFFLVIL